MKMPRKFTATAISALALALGVSTLQAPSASAAERTLEAPVLDSSTVNALGGQDITFVFFHPKSSQSTNAVGGETGRGRIVFRQFGDPGTDAVIEERDIVDGLRLTARVPNVDGAQMCAIAEFPTWRFSSRLSYPPISAETCVPIRPASTLFPRAPYLSAETARDGIYPTGTVNITVPLAGQLATGEEITLRHLVTSTMNTGNPVSCDIGSNDELTLLTDLPNGTTGRAVRAQRIIPAGTIGQYLCMQQKVQSTRMTEPKYSEPVTYRITSNPNVGAGVPSLNLGSALARLQEASQRLQQVQGQPNVNQAALAAAAAEAEEARRQAEAAAAQAQARAAAATAQGQAAPAGTPSAAQIAQAQQEAEAAAAAVEQAIGQATAGTTKQTALSALAIATGFDPFTTPVLQAREKNASGVSIEVTAPPTIRQKKRLFTKLEVLDPVTRGGMRQYLLDLNGPTPRLMLKRTGFVPDAVENKRYWISEKFQPGTYGLLTTFLPSTPGIQGVAVYDTIEVTKAPKKKKKKRR